MIVFIIQVIFLFSLKIQQVFLREFIIIQFYITQVDRAQTMSNNQKNILKITQQQFGKMYKYYDIIDQGSYGVVCKYEDLQTKQFVAIKVLKQQDGIQGFKNQEEIMKKIVHQNVLKCLGFYYNITKCRYLLVMPFCDNNLKKCIGEISQFDQGFKVGLCLQIARGLSALHQKNIMHRDIKPANILVCKNWKLKLCDFGFGKEDQGLNNTVKIGTPVYRDPNIHSGKYTKKCDIYSTGLVFDLIFRGKGIFENVPQQRFRIQLTYFLRNQKKIISALNCCQQMKNIILDCIVQQQNKRLDSHQLVKKLQDLSLKFNPKSQQQSVLKEQSKIFQSNINYNDEKKQFKSFSLQIEEEKKSQNENKFNKIVKNIDLLNNKPQIDVTNIKINRMETYNFNEKSTENSDKNQLFATEIAKVNSKHILIQQNDKKSSSQKYQSNFGVKLLKAGIQISKNVQKNLNFQTVYTYFVDRKNKIRELENIEKIKSINQNDKKIVIFLALFGYLRFLKISKLFLKHEKSILKNIEGVPIQKISEGTISNCLQIINKQAQKAKILIKPCLLDLYQDKRYYKQALSKNVLKYISEGYEKKFTQIEQYSQHQISQEYENILMNQRYTSYEQEETKLKKKLLEISKVF